MAHGWTTAFGGGPVLVGASAALERLTDLDGAVEVARDFLGRAAGAPARAPRAHQSAAGDPVLLAPIRWSRQFQVVDGHHRLAIGAVRGAPTVGARG